MVLLFGVGNHRGMATTATPSPLVEALRPVKKSMEARSGPSRRMNTHGFPLVRVHGPPGRSVPLMPQSSHVDTLLAGIGPGSAAAAPKPNILYIVADDLGWKDVGFHGSEIQTPSLDELAQDGRHARPVLRPADVHADARRADDRPLSASLRTAELRHPARADLRPADRRTAPAAGAQGGRLRDRDHRQMASRSCQPRLTGPASAASTTSTAR